MMRRPASWREQIRWAVLDLSGPYRAAFDTAIPDAAQVADPFHVVRLANTALEEVRRRVQNAAEEPLRSVYDITDANTGAATGAQLASDLQDPAMPTEINRLGRTISRWRTQIANWHTAQVTNAATEAANNLIPVLEWGSPAGGDGFLMVGDRVGV